MYQAITHMVNRRWLRNEEGLPAAAAVDANLLELIPPAELVPPPPGFLRIASIVGIVEIPSTVVFDPDSNVAFLNKSTSQFEPEHFSPDDDDQHATIVTKMSSVVPIQA